MSKSKMFQYILYLILSMIISAVFCALWILIRNTWYLSFSKSENEDLLAHFVPAIVITIIYFFVIKIIQKKFSHICGKIGFTVFSVAFMVLSLFVLVIWFLGAPFA